MPSTMSFGVMSVRGLRSIARSWHTSAGPVTADTDVAGWNGWTLRQVINSAQLSNSGDTKIRITMEAGAAEGFAVNAAYVGHAAAAGDAYDFETTPVQLQVGASNSWTISAGAQQVTDSATFTLNTSKNLIVSIQCNSATDTSRSKVTQTGWQSYSRNALDASTVNTTGYASGNAVQLVVKVETMP